MIQNTNPFPQSAAPPPSQLAGAGSPPVRASAPLSHTVYDSSWNSGIWHGHIEF